VAVLVDVVRAHLQIYLEQILTRMQGLMVLSCPDNGLKCQTLSAEDQQFIYETAGVLVVQSQFTADVSSQLNQSCCFKLCQSVYIYHSHNRTYRSHSTTYHAHSTTYKYNTTYHPHNTVQCIIHKTPRIIHSKTRTILN